RGVFNFKAGRSGADQARLRGFPAEPRRAKRFDIRTSTPDWALTEEGDQMPDPAFTVPGLLEKHQGALLSAWQTQLEQTPSRKISASELAQQTREFLHL